MCDLCRAYSVSVHAADRVTTAPKVAQALPNAVGGGAPDWIELIPAGRFTGADGRGPFDATDTGTIIADFHRRKRKLPVDENHSIDLTGTTGAASPARGWITELEARNGSIWGRVEWTDEGERLVTSRAYGFVSPVFTHSKAPAGRIVRLLSASLVNDPNLELASLHAREGTTMDETEFLDALRKALTLPATADHAAIIEAVTETVTSRNSVDPTQYVPFEIFRQTRDELMALNGKGLPKADAEHTVTMAMERGHLLPFMKDYAVELCMKDAGAFAELMHGKGGLAGMTSHLFKPGIDTASMHGRDMKASGKAAPDGVSKTLGLTSDDYAQYGRKDRHDGYQPHQSDGHV